MRSIKALVFALIVSLAAAYPHDAQAIRACKALPKKIKVLKKSSQCGKVPTVALSGTWKNSFSAAFRWDDGSEDGEDRSPFDLDNPDAQSSPYKTQRRIRTARTDYLCYGKFIKRAGYPTPVQLTIKKTAAPNLNRFCVSF
ncbi:MAG: hypothetical protein J5J00_04485 [Deltaproteobacteria bacterium]|nr:hypothetical protein [Deltaproteobacteria bacterium]